MGESRFDLLAKSAATGTRRSMLRASLGAVFGSALAFTGLRSVSAARKRPDGASCRADSDCESDYCFLWDEKHNRGTCEAFCETYINGCEPK